MAITLIQRLGFGRRNMPSAANAALRVHWIFTWSPEEKRLRLFSFVWATGEDSGAKDWHSNQLSFGLSPRLFRWEPEMWGWALTVLGLRIHRKRSYGGWFA